MRSDLAESDNIFLGAKTDYHASLLILLPRATLG